ncbi:MAG TPA: PadR family transcriptional regulator [Cyclobacteriaceae bacterium]|nr:PadR family transcriptional regulator [Cyclobacteriaceae bacterium]
MKGTYIGEFEELVLLAVSILQEDAYSIAVAKEIHRVTKRRVVFTVVHAALIRLEQKGFLESRLGGATNERGGRSKRFFTISTAGKKALLKAKSQRDQMWQMIPKVTFKNI